jgi:hypothetical protein
MIAMKYLLLYRFVFGSMNYYTMEHLESKPQYVSKNSAENHINSPISLQAERALADTVKGLPDNFSEAKLAELKKGGIELNTDEVRHILNAK